MANFRLSWALVAAAFAIPVLDAAQPWDTPFQPDIKSILEAASRVAPREHPPVTVLLDEYRYTIHNDGRIDAIARRVFRVEQQDAIAGSSSVEQPYQPWHQRKPEFKARVIAKDGDEQWFDPKTLSDAPARQFDSSIFSDLRMMRAPLPRVQVGSIVEIQTLLSDTAPLLDAGFAQNIAFPIQLPIERAHVLIEAEPGVALTTASKLVPDTAVHRSADQKGVRVEYDWGPIAAVKYEDLESNLPFDTTNYPRVLFATGKSWMAIAARYSGIVDQQIANADLKKLMDGVDLKGTPLEVAARLTARLHKSVRYTGVEFAEAAIVPARPEETIQRGYGDCKDKAALLVAMLRAAGLKANVALLNAGLSLDPERDLPGMGVFNHAIVYVDASPPLWIDATAADTRVGFLPAMDEGHLALIARPNTGALTMTPEAESKNDWEHQTIDVSMSSMGLGQFHVTYEFSGGTREANARVTIGSGNPQYREQFEKNLKAGYVAKALGKVDSMARDDMSGPFRVRAEVRDTSQAVTGMNDAAVTIWPGTLFFGLPPELTANDGDDLTKRERDYLVPSPFQMEVHYIIHPPPLFKVGKLPSPAQIKLGSASYSKHFEAKPDGVIDAVYRLDTGKRRMTVSEFREFRAALKAIPKSADQVIFAPVTAEFIALGQTSRAITMLRDQIKAHPDDAMLHARLATVVVGAGLGDVAVAEAKAARDLDPKSAPAWSVAGVVAQYDTFGRIRQGNWNAAESEAALRKAMELDPDDQLVAMNLAILLEFNREGWRYAAGSRVDEAIALYRDLAKKPEHHPAVDQNLAVLLMHNRRFDEAREELNKLATEGGAVLRDTIVAMEENPAQAIIKAQAAYPDVRQQATHLASVSQTLVTFREYPAASALMAAAGRLVNAADAQARAEVLSKVARWQDKLLPEKDPGWAIQQITLDLFKETLNAERLKALTSNRIQGALQAEQIRAMRAGIAGAQQQLAASGIEQESILDWIFSLIVIEKTGDAQHGYHLRAMMPGTPAVIAMYVIPEDGKFKIAGLPPTGLEAVSALILEFLNKGDLKTAQLWLDQVSKDSEPAADGTGRPAVALMWPTTSLDRGRGAEEVRIAAAAMLGSSTGSPKALATLQAARAKADNDSDRGRLDKAICETLAAAKKWGELMIASRRLESSRMYAVEGYQYFIRAATRAGKWKDLENDAMKMISMNHAATVVTRVVPKPAYSSGDLVAMRAIVLSRWKQGDMESVDDWLKKIIEADLGGTDERVFAAWVEMAQGKAAQDSLDRLKKGKNLAGQDKSYAFVFAMMQATLGMSDDAAQSLSRAIGGQDLDSLPAVAWAVHGKICELDGLMDCAKSSREKAIQIATASSDDDKSQWLIATLGRSATN